MAISAPHYRALQTLAERCELPIGGRILEIGEANWYGDIEPPFLANGAWAAWDVVKAVYQSLMHPQEVCSIDFDGTPAAKKYDLNQQCSPNPIFDVVYNHGTAEHIFNIANVFRFAHDSCKVGGLMIHESPFTGWIDHGFYCLQPTLFYDVAAANGYDIRHVAMEHIESKWLCEVSSREEIHKLARQYQIPNNAMLYVAMRRTNQAAFQIPMQGVYARTVSQETQKAWRALR